MTVGILVVVHLEGHNFSFSVVYGQPRSSGLLGLASANFFGLVLSHMIDGHTPLYTGHSISISGHSATRDITLL